MDSELVEIMIVVISIILSAFFSGMEIAYVAHNRLQLEIDFSRGRISLPFIRFIFKNPSKYIATMLVGNNAALVIYGLAIAKILEPIFEHYISSEFSILLIQTIISTIIILFFAEFIPKSIFRAYPNISLNIFSPFVAFFYIIFYPITILTIGITNFVIKYVIRQDIVDDSKQRILGRADLDNFIDQIRIKFNYDQELDDKLRYIEKTLDFENIKVRQCMVPRNEIEAVPVNTTIEQIQKIFSQSQHSKLIVYEDNIDNVIGYIHVRSLFSDPSNIKDILIKIPIVPETMSAKKLLDLLIKEKKSVALVVDEYGGTSGIITMEDVLEEIVGEIQDEYDEEEFIEEKLNDKEFIFSARLEIHYLNEKYGFNLPISKDYNTLAGLILNKLEAIPQTGEKIQISDYIFEVLQRDGPKLKKVKMILDKDSTPTKT